MKPGNLNLVETEILLQFA